MSEESDMATCVEILEEAHKLLPGRFGGLDNTIRELKSFEDDVKKQREKLIEICTRKIDGSQELNFLKPISFGLKSRIHNFSRFIIDSSESVARRIVEILGSKDKVNPTAYNFMLCATYLFVELFAQEEEIKKEREANVNSSNDEKITTATSPARAIRENRSKTPSSNSQQATHTIPNTTRSQSHKPKRHLALGMLAPRKSLQTNPDQLFNEEHHKPKRHLELRMLVESTYLAPLESLQTTPDQPLNEEQIEAVFKRPNIHALHARAQAGSAGERSFVYDNGESFFVKTSQLYLCVNIELECKETSYQELLTTKSLSVMKRRLRGARFTLRELRYEKLNDTDRVTTGKDD